MQDSSVRVTALQSVQITRAQVFQLLLRGWRLAAGLLLTFVMIALPSMASATTFTLASGKGTENINSASAATWDENFETLNFAVSGAANAYGGACDGLIGVDNSNPCLGVNEWLVSNSATGSQVISVTISITNKVFDLSQMTLTDWANSGRGSYSITTSRGGTKPGTVAGGNTPTPATFSGSAFQGISSFTITFTGSGGSITALGLSNLILNNITSVSTPSVSGISPTSGPAAGGTSVVITGSNFAAVQGSSGVKFGSNNASSYSVDSATQITAIAPSGTGAQYITVSNVAGTSSLGSQFTYIAAPTVSSLSVTSGPLAGGSSVVITGTNLTDATAVKFGSTSISGFTIDSASKITATVPAGSVGSVYVTVTTPGGTSTTGTGNQYTYVALPVISIVSPTFGTTLGGTSVALTGTGFTDATAVKFGLTNASYTVNSATSITATAPVHAQQGTVDVTVTTVGGTSATGASTRFSYAAAPTATTGGAGSITATGASIVGTANDNGASTTLSFEYGLTTSYTSTATATPASLSAGSSSTAVSGSLSGLSCNTTYHYRLKAVNGINTNDGSDASFTTAACPPTATTVAASSLTATGATLNGTVSSNGTSTTVTFEYGTTTGYGTSVTAAQSPLAFGASGASVTKAITDLSCNTTYHFRVVGSSSAGSTNGSDTTFTTTACVPGAPTVGTATAGSTQVSVAFTAPASNGGASITSYTVTSSPGGFTGTGASSPINVTGLTNGTAYTFTVTATNSAGTGVASTASSSVAPKNTQTITFNQPVTQNFGMTPTLSASSNSGLAPTFTSSTTGVCTITSGGALSFVSAGLCTINANQAGDGSYLAAAQVSQSFTVNAVAPGAPTAAAATAGNTSASVTFTAPTFTGGTSITGYTVTSSPGGFTGTGASSPINVTGLTNGTAYTFTVTATNSAGTGVASTASSSVAPKNTQTIAFANPGTQNFGTTPTLSASSNSGLAPTFTSGTTGVCTITSGGALSFVSAGLCTINANQAGDGSYLAAAQVSQSFTVNVVLPGAPVIGTATAGNTQATVTFTAPASNGGAAITGYTVISIPAGGVDSNAGSTGLSHVITGLTNSTSYTFTVKATNSTGTGPASGASKSVTPTAVLPPTVGAVNTSVAYGSSNNAITLNVTGTYASVAVAGAASHGTATASGTSITYTPTAGYAGSDSFTYTATNLGGTSLPATVTINVVAPAPSAAVIGTATAGDKQATVSFTLSTSTGAGSATSYTVTATPGGASATGSSSPITVTGLSNGTAYTFVVVASNSGGSSVASAASNSVTPKGAQTITLNNPGTQSFTATPSVSATASSGLPVTLSASGSVCSVSANGSLSFQSAGTCTVTASQAGNDVWNAASASQSFTVNPVPPSPPGITSIVTASTQATVAFTPPTFTGGTPIVGYQITATPTASASTSKLLSVLAAPAGAGVVTATGTSSPIIINGLTNGVTYTFAVTALNSVGSGTTTKKVDGDPATGTPQETVPVAQAVSTTVAYGSSNNAITLNLGGSAATSLTVVSTPSHGTASINGTRLSYTPAAGYAGKDSFTYTASNGAGTSAAATVSITVTPQAPSAGNVTLSVLAGSNGTAVPLALGGGATDSVTLGSSPSHGTATVNGARITYTPEANYTGSDSFTYIASNTGGTSAPGTVSIQVVARPDPTKDAEVTGLLNAQATVATRFAQTQISNVQTHLESLHGRPIAKPDDEKKRTLAGRNGRIGKANPLSTDSGTSSTDASTGTTSASIGTSTGTTTGTGTATGSSQKTCASRDPKLCEIMSSGSGSAELAGYIVTASQSIKDGSGWPWRSLNLNGKNDLGNGSEVWSAGTITLGRQGDSDLNFTSSGVSFGADQRINEKLVLGMSIGFGYENQKIGDASTRNNAQSYSVTGYQSYQPTPSTYLDGLLGYSHLNYDLKRHVSAIDADANADRTGSQWFASLSGGYEYRQENSLLSPYGRFDWISTRLNRNEESGAGSYNLTYFDQTIPVTKVSVGLRGETQKEISNGKAKPYFRVEYQRNLESPSTAEMAYADLLSTIYRYDLSNVDRNTLVFGLGSNFVIRKNREWLLGYQYSVGSGSAEAHTVNLQFKQAF